MRRALAGIALAVTSMVALSFLIPLALLVREQARDRVTTAAEQRAAALSPVLALTTRRADVQQAVAELGSADQLVVRLPDGGFVGTPHAPEEALDRAVRGRDDRRGHPGRLGLPPARRPAGRAGRRQRRARRGPPHLGLSGRLSGAPVPGGRDRAHRDCGGRPRA
ncbi:hypothetical protein STENM327S_05671 [Streptomyces tendae]